MRAFHLTSTSSTFGLPDDIPVSQHGMNMAYWHQNQHSIGIGAEYTNQNWTHRLDILSTQQADRTTQALIRLPRTVYIPRLNLSLPHTYYTNRPTSLARSRRSLFFSATASEGRVSGAWSSFSLAINKVEECTWYIR